MALASLVASLGCASSPYDHAWISGDIARRTGAFVGPQRPTEASSLPRGVSLEDGLSAEESVALALWNNPRFHADLAQLGLSRADLTEAGQLPNPLLTLMLPLGEHPLSLRVQAPLDALWQRPRRVAAAQREVERVARGLVQSGLDLARDVRLAHAEVLVAQERQRLRALAVEALTQLAELTRVRAAAGDLGEAEPEAALGELLLARDAAQRTAAEVELAQIALRALVGFAADPRALRAVPEPMDDARTEPLEEVLRFALAARPDLRAAELAVEAAGERAGWERSRIVSLTAALDGVTPGATGSAFAPGVIAPLPIFNLNQGAIQRAEAEAEQCAWRLMALRAQVLTEVRQAHGQLQMARESRGRFRAEVLPSLDRSVQLATEQFSAGESSYLTVLEATRRALDGSLRLAELEAEARRATAQRDRSAGGSPR